MKFKKEYSFDEKKDAENIIEFGFPDKKINYVDMQKVAKYFRYVSGFGAVRLEKQLIKFCLEQDPDFNPITERESISKWIKIAMNNTMRKVDGINITRSEANIIREIKNLKHRKILLGVLILAKAIKQGRTFISKKEVAISNKYHIQYDKFINIIRITKTSMTEIELCDILYEFGQMGLLKFYNAERESILLNFTDDDSEIEFVFNDPNTFIDFFNKEFSGKIIFCNVCKKEITKKNNKHIMCDDCAKDVKRKQDAEWIKKKRNVGK